jgi:hypothetical protein
MTTQQGVQVYHARETIKISPDAIRLTIGVPTRGLGPIEFYLSLFQSLQPLNVRLSYSIQKGLLPAAARNRILHSAIERNTKYVIFLDDDMIFPDITLYRLYDNMKLHPEAACITAVYSSKLEPSEPFLYNTEGDGCFWDWPLGALVPVESAGAGCMIVDTDWVKKMDVPLDADGIPTWFDDQVTTRTTSDVRTRVKASWGHDRLFMRRLQDLGGVNYADTGLLLAHLDCETQRVYIIPPEAPCFQQMPRGEAFFPVYDEGGAIYFRRIGPVQTSPETFKGYLQYLDSLAEPPETDVQSMLGGNRGSFKS